MTLNEMITDMLLTIRGSKVVQSEPITRDFLLFHINTYRARLISEQVAKHEPLDKIHIQPLSCISLSEVDKSDCPNIHNTCKFFLRTEKLPKPIASTNGNLYTFIGDIHGFPWQLINEEDYFLMKQRKYTKRDTFVFFKDYRLYVMSNQALDRMTVRGVFEDPTDLVNYVNNCTQMANFTWDSDYPLSARIYPVLKEMILRKELGIIVQAMSDNKNDSNHAVSPNIEQERQ